MRVDSDVREQRGLAALSIGAALLWMAAMVVLIGEMVVWVPRCELAFKDLGIALPGLTVMTLTASRWIGTWWFVLFPLAIAVAAAPVVYRRVELAAAVLVLAVAGWLACGW